VVLIISKIEPIDIVYKLNNNYRSDVILKKKSKKLMEEKKSFDEILIKQIKESN
jgi:hypothetical protein